MVKFFKPNCCYASKKPCDSYWKLGHVGFRIIIKLQRKRFIKKACTHFFSTKGVGFWRRHFQVTYLVPMLFSLEVWEKKKPWETSIYYTALFCWFLLPSRAKIFAGLVKNWLTSTICSANLGILLFKILMISIITLKTLYRRVLYFLFVEL